MNAANNMMMEMKMMRGREAITILMMMMMMIEMKMRTRGREAITSLAAAVRPTESIITLDRFPLKRYILKSIF